MYSRFIYCLLVAGTLVLANCAHQKVRHDVESEVKNEPAHKTSELAAKSYSAIEQSPNFTPEQKLRLTRLIEKTRAESKRINQEDSKLKGVLIDAITASPYQAAQVEEIKIQLKKVNNRRIGNILTALNEVENILGKDHHAHQLIYQELILQPPISKQIQ